MKSKTDLYKRCRFTVEGYFALPLSVDDMNVSNSQQWFEFDTRLSEAKRGEFTGIPQLADWIAKSNDWVLQGQYVQLFGDAGSKQSLNAVLHTLPVGRNISLEFAYGQAFEYWGHLSVIPALIDMYERYSFSDDAMYVALSLSRLMEETPGKISEYPLDKGENEVKQYCHMVRQRYEELCARLGTRDAVVFRGDVISIQRICKKMLDDLGRRHGFHEEMRHKFEAYTGVDCSTLYVDEVPQPLAAAAIVEEFLESPKAEKYKEGVRYFFGHRIPD